MKEIVGEVSGELKQLFVFNLRGCSTKKASQLFYRSFLQTLYMTFEQLLNSFKIWEFQTQNVKAKPKGKKPNIAVP